MRLLIVDNHDSFTFNLVEYVRRVTNTEPTVVPNDTPWASVDLAAADAVLISPGPGTPANPADLGITADVLREFDGPILGVCLGLQAMVHLAGGTVGPAPRPAHGEEALVAHDGTGLFRGLPNPLPVVRYHSLAAAEVPERFTVTARLTDATAAEDGMVMGIAATERPRWAVQFHPESVRAEAGEALIANFLELARAHYASEFFAVRTLDHALDPAAVAAQLTGNRFWLTEREFSILGDDSGPRARHLSFDVTRDDVFAELSAALAAHRLPDRVGPPIPGCGFALGWVGYFGYEVGEQVLPALRGHLPHAPGPDAEFVFTDRAVVIDHARGVTHCVSLRGDTDWDVATADAPAAMRQPVTAGLVHDEADYLALIDRAQAAMARGESYEVCLTNRLELPTAPEPLGAYLSLRAENPTPRGGFIDLAGNALLSTSPELFLAVDANGRVTSKPIKGTRPRSDDPAEDSRLKSELARAKERSELLMVVDMVRHDLSRVCERVAVPAPFIVESYATVHQLVCVIEGHLRAAAATRPAATAVDALCVAFPGGSMTGAPKLRTMEIIAALEDTWRGVYSGAYGYLGLNGAADFSMTIRGLVVPGAEARSAGAPAAYYGMGGAVLHVSDPHAEWEETLVKTRPLRALGVEL